MKKKSQVYWIGFSLATEQQRQAIERQIRPSFFTKMDKDWINGYLDGLKEAHPDLVEKLLAILSDLSKDCS